MKNKKLQKKLLKLTQEFRDEAERNIENVMMGDPEDTEAYSRLKQFVKKQLKKESEK